MRWVKINNYELILDIKKRLTNTNITLVQNDVESTGFKFLIKDGNRDYELVGQVELAIKKADGTFVVIPCAVSSSTATVTLTEQALTVPGRTLGEVRILSEGKVLTSTQCTTDSHNFTYRLHPSG